VRREIILIVRPLGSARLTGSDRPTDIVTPYHANRRERCRANSASKWIWNPAQGFQSAKT